MKHGFFALKSGDSAEYKNTFRKEVKVSEALASEKVAKDETRNLSTVQEIMTRSTDYLRRILAPAVRQGSVTMSYLCRIVIVSRWKTSFGGSLVRKHNNWWCAICGLKATKHAFGVANKRKC